MVRGSGRRPRPRLRSVAEEMRRSLQFWYRDWKPVRKGLQELALSAGGSFRGMTGTPTDLGA
eukprot:4328985-Heterocapsa_arctica.AAC.1